VARLVEAVVAERLIREPWGAALVAYEGALFRVEAGPRRWAAAVGAAVIRAPTARIVTLDWDVTGLEATEILGETVTTRAKSARSRKLARTCCSGSRRIVRAGSPRLARKSCAV
jgi:hypothetical protein